LQICLRKGRIHAEEQVTIKSICKGMSSIVLNPTQPANIFGIKTNMRYIFFIQFQETVSLARFKKNPFLLNPFYYADDSFILMEKPLG